MNIKEAVERIEMLNKNITEQENLSSIIKREDLEEVWCAISAEYSSHRNVAFNKEVLLEFIEVNIQRNRTEVSRLQPIINMANAALKGVLS